jgi:hypothetical protein
LGQKPVGLETRPPPEGRPATEASEATSDENRAGPQAPVPAASTPDLPDYAEKADDLEAIKKAVDDAASVGGACGSVGMDLTDSRLEATGPERQALIDAIKACLSPPR